MLKAVFFDAAGTLIDTAEPVGRTYARLAREFGADASEQAVEAAFRHAFGAAPPLAFGPGRDRAELRALERQWWRERVRETFRELGAPVDFDAYFAALFAHFAQPAHWSADPEALGLLLRLKERGFSVGVISNFDARIYGIFDGLGLLNLFDSVTISSEAGYAKPDREVFAAALARHAIEPREALHVGDSHKLDFEGARAAGLAAVLLDRAAPVPTRVSGRSATVSSLASVPDVAQVLAVA
jgi:putative hydrolase of the HAD superfamily